MSVAVAPDAPAGPVRPRTRAGAAEPAREPWRPAYGAAAIAAAAVFALYVATLAPTTAMWDASEYITAAHVLGVPHPPGNPLFVLLGHVASRLPIAEGVAMRINLLAAACSALAAGVWFLVADRVASRSGAGRATRGLAGALAALVGATAFTVWNQSVVNEKVYTVSLAFFAVVAWLVVRWCDDPDAPRADRRLVLAAYLVALGYTNHPAGFLVAPAVLAGVALRRPRTLLDGRLLVRAALAFALGLTPFAVLPIRAAHHPALNQGEVTACVDGPRVACTLSRETWTRLGAHLGRAQYAKPPLAERQAPIDAQVGMWWQYFRWQWLRDAHGTQRGAQTALAVVFLALGLAGGWVHLRRDRASFGFFGPLVLSVSLGLVVYMNLKYGATQAPALGDAVPREVRDRDYFYLWSFSTWGVWVALGLVGAWRALAAAVARGGGAHDATTPTRRALLLASPVLALAAVPLVANWRPASRAGQRDVAAFAHDLLASVEPYGVLITYGDNDTFPLWYAQEVEGMRRDVTVICLELMNTDWYPRQLARRAVEPYDAARGPAAYRGRVWPAPTTPLFRLSTAELDAVPIWTPLDGPRVFERAVGRDTLRVTLAQPALLRADLLALYLLRDAWPARPVHVARSTGPWAQSLGLGPYLLTQGLARKVLPRPAVLTPDTLAAPEGGAYDVRRSLALWRAYRAPDALAARSDWVDPPSVGIPNLVTITGLELSEALARTGRVREARQALDSATRIARVTRQTAAFGLPDGARRGG